jgi:hypothetical protein
MPWWCFSQTAHSLWKPCIPDRHTLTRIGTENLPPEVEPTT